MGFKNPIVGGGGELIRTNMHSRGWANPGDDGWAILKDGNAYFTDVTINTDLDSSIPNMPVQVSIESLANSIGYMNQYSERSGYNNTSRNTTGVDAIITGILFTTAATTAFSQIGEITISGSIPLQAAGAGAGAVSLSLWAAMDPSAAPVDGDLTLWSIAGGLGANPVTIQDTTTSKTRHGFHFSVDSVPLSYYTRWRLKVSHAGGVAYNIALSEMAAVFRVRPILVGATA